jgi:hypothetical protein
MDESAEPVAAANRGLAARRTFEEGRFVIKTIEIRLPPSLTGFILEIMCWRKSRDPSAMLGKPAPKRPSVPSCSASSRMTRR